MTSEDLPQVENIQARITRKSVSEPWREMLAKHAQEQDHMGVVAIKDGKVIGFVLGEIKTGNFGEEASGWLDLVGVEPEHMGAGIGRALAVELFKQFETMGVDAVHTSVRWDSGDMLAFFKGLGFDRSPFINLRRRLGAS